MSEEKGLTTQGMTTWHLLLIVLAVAILADGIYLTRHYWDLHFNDSLVTEAFCNINQFFQCDTATKSAGAQILGIPTSVYGIMFGIFLLIGSLLPSPAMERTNFVIAGLNACACLALLFYSLFGLSSLCPMCTLYYLLSLGVFALFWKHGHRSWRVDPKIALSFFALFALVGGSFAYKTQKTSELMTKNRSAIKKSLLSQFQALKEKATLPPPSYFSDYFLTGEAQDWTTTPLRLSYFSDFQCPACKALAPTLEKLMKAYEGRIAIQYYAFPLDQNCNEQMNYQLHPFACQAAYVALCAKDQLHSVHEKLFADQEDLSEQYLKRLAQQRELTECAQGEQVKGVVQKMLQVAQKDFKVSGTPTLVVNGVLISRSLSFEHYKILFDAILAGEL